MFQIDDLLYATYTGITPLAYFALQIRAGMGKVLKSGMITIQMFSWWEEPLSMTTYVIERNARMGGIMADYCRRKGVAVSDAHFLQDGQRIFAHDTPDALGIEDGCMIDLLTRVIG